MTAYRAGTHITRCAECNETREGEVYVDTIDASATFECGYGHAFDIDNTDWNLDDAVIVGEYEREAA